MSAPTFQTSTHGTMSAPTLNWLDKTVWALAKINREESAYNIILTKVVFAVSFGIGIISIYRFFWKVAGVVDISPPSDYGTLLLVFAACYLPIHFTTHSAAEILAADLSKKERWVYTTLGLLIFPLSWGIFGWTLVWLESG